MSRDTKQDFDGEAQIEKTLTAHPVKLYLDVEDNFDGIRDKAQDLLWPENIDEARWSDVADRYAEQAGMYWLPPRGLDTLKSIACNRGLWEDLGNGYVTKKPKKKRTSAQIIVESEPNDKGEVRLRINPQNAGPAARIYIAENGQVSENSPQLTDQTITTSALRVSLLVKDPSGQYDTGEVVTWHNKLVLRNALSEQNGQRQVALFVAPTGNIRYTLDGSEPREGTAYTGPVAIGSDDVLMRVFAEAEGLEAKQDFRFPAQGKKGVQIDPVKPGRIVSRIPRKLDSRAKTFAGLKQAADQSVTFEGVMLTVGQGNQVIAIQVGDVPVEADFIEALLSQITEKFPPETPVTMTFRKADFASGHDLKAFADKLGIELNIGDVEQ